MSLDQDLEVEKTSETTWTITGGISKVLVTKVDYPQYCDLCRNQAKYILKVNGKKYISCSTCVSHDIAIQLDPEETYEPKTIE